MVAHVGLEGGVRRRLSQPQPDVYSGDGKCLTNRVFQFTPVGRLAPSKLRRKEMSMWSCFFQFTRGPE